MRCVYVEKLNKSAAVFSSSNGPPGRQSPFEIRAIAGYFMHRGIFRRKKKQVIRGYATQHETGIFFWEAENIFWMKTTRREEETSFSSSISRSWGRTRLWRRERRAFSPPPFPILHLELIYPGDTAKKYRPGQESRRSNRATMGYLHLRREEGGDVTCRFCP